MKNIFLLILSILFVITSKIYLFEFAQNKVLQFSSQSILNILFVFIVYYFLKQAFSFSLEKRVNILALIFSLIFTCILQVGKTIYYTDTIINFFGSGIIITLLQTISFCTIFFASLRVLCQYINTYNKKNQINFLYKIKNKYFCIVTFTLIFISFFLAFLAYFPGILSYDSVGEFSLTNGYSRFDPPIFCYFCKMIHRLGIYLSIEPIIIYGIFQMFFLSYAMTRTICFLKNSLINGTLLFICFLFILLNPTIAIFSMIPAKDPILACFLQLLAINIMQYLNKPNILKNNLLKQSSMIFQITFCCLVRNNVIFAFIPTLLFILINRYFNLAKLFFIGIVLYFCVQYPVYNYLNVKDGSIAESMSVPLNQFANIVVNDEDKLTIDGKEAIDTFLPYNIIKRQFNPRFGDPIKFYFNSTNFLLHKKYFLTTYFNLFFKFPVRYIDAFLNLCLPYWYFDASSIDKYSKRAFIEDWVWDNTEYHFTRKSFSNTLLNYYQGFANLKHVKNVPVLYFFFSLATPFFLILLASFIIITQKQYKGFIIIFLYASLLGTCFLAPVSNFRYIFPFVCFYPVLIAFIFSSKSFFNNTSKIL